MLGVAVGFGVLVGVRVTVGVKVGANVCVAEGFGGTVEVAATLGAPAPQALKMSTSAIIMVNADLVRLVFIGFSLVNGWIHVPIIASSNRQFNIINRQ